MQFNVLATKRNPNTPKRHPNALWIFAGISLSSVAFAQELPPHQVAPETQKTAGAMLLQPLPLPVELKAQPIVVRNVKPSYIAWKLDPVHNPEPLEIQASRKNRSNVFAPPQEAAAQEVAPLPLPGGVESVVPIDPQNILIVRGTEDGARQLKERVTELDRPMKQIEIEVQVVCISPQDSKVLESESVDAKRYTLPATNGEAPITVRSASTRQLTKLIQDKKAAILTAPRVLAISGLTANIGTQAANPEPIELKNAPGIEAATGFQFTATPTLDKNETIGVSFALAKTLQLSRKNVTGVFPLQALDVLSANLTFNDGEILMLSGPEGRIAALIGGLSMSKLPVKSSNLVILLKATRIRRFGDEEHVPGT